MENKLKQDISIGQNLKKYRLRAGLTQENVATRLQIQGLDVHSKIVSQMELGQYSVRVSVLIALAKMYDVSIQAFFENLDSFEQKL